MENEKDSEENKINEEMNEEDENESKIIDELNEDEETKKEEKKEDKQEEEKRKDSGLDLTDDKDFEHMKEELNKATNFIDYFCVVGLPPKIYLESWLYESKLDVLNKKYKDNLQPKITSSFPPFEKQTIAFDESVISHCFPKGFKLIKSSKQPKTQIFSFILDNNYFNLNFPQKYLTCLICYENITKYKELYDTYQIYSKTLSENKEEEKEKDNNIPEQLAKKKEETKKTLIKSLTHFYAQKGMIKGGLDPKANESKNDILHKNIKLKDPNIYIPKCLMVMSLYPYFAEYEKILTEIYNYSLIVDEKDNELYKKNTLNMTDINTNLDKIKPSLTLANLECHIKETNSGISIPIDKIIENLLIELPVPPRGIFSVDYTLINEERKLKQNLMNELPLVDINLKRLFSFEIKEIVDMYHNLFLETRILFFSEDIQSLNMFIYGLLSLLYPFQYQYQVVTILPQENFTIIESITPFIAGINMAFTEDFFDKYDLTLSDSILIVDIDNKKMDFVNKLAEIPEFPKGYRKTLEKNLQSIKSKYFKGILNYKTLRRKKSEENEENVENLDTNSEHNKEVNLNEENNINEEKMEGNQIKKAQTTVYIEENKKDEFEIIPDLTEEEIENDNRPYSNFEIDFEFNKEVNELFFNFNANLLSGYNKFLNTDFYSSNNSPCLEVLFKVDEYLNSVSSSDRAFYDKFISETQIFGDFLYMRMIPKTTKEKIQVLAFDEKINENNSGVFSRSSPIVFINSREYDYVNTYKVQKPRPLTKQEIEFYKKKENKIKLLNYGIIVSEMENGQIVFEYPVFPCLTYKYFFKNNITEYFLPMNLNENVESINTDIVAKSHLGGVAMRLNDMDNYIYLCWMQMWAITFWYCDEKEKRYRFQELLKVLNKTSSHEMEIFNLLFETLSIYGEDYMILKLYDILLTLHLNPSFKVHNIVMKLLDKKKLEGQIKDNLQNAFKDELKNIYTNKGFRNRTFKSKYYGNILTSDIIFFAFDSCISCQKDIDLETVSMNFKEMDRELTWTKCPGCGNPILPKISVQFGKEINKTGKMKLNTCKLDSVVLFSPFFLKDNYNSVALRAYGVKLDVEDLLLKYNNIFWNSLWYFKLKNLEYDFMLPYEEEIEKQVDDYLDISIGDDEENVKKYNKEKYIRNFDVDAFKSDKFEIVLSK